MSDYLRGIAYSYAVGTELRAQAIEAQRELDSEKAEEQRERMASVPHQPQPWHEDPNFCSRCSVRVYNQIHFTRKES